MTQIVYANFKCCGDEIYEKERKKWKPHETLFIRFSYEIDVKVLLSIPQFYFWHDFLHYNFFLPGNRSIGRTHILHCTWINYDT